MNKKANIIDDKEDEQISKIAHSKNSSSTVLMVILIVLFCFILINTLLYIQKYYSDNNKIKNGIEATEIKNDKNNVIVLNDSNIEKTIVSEDLNGEDIIITKISSIELVTNRELEQDSKIRFDVKYEIIDNTFSSNLYSSSESNLKVRFAYSNDLENWTYLDNAVSTNDGSLTPLRDYYYDISGLKTTIRAITNYEISSHPGEKRKIYWKSETYIKNDSNNIGKFIKANFKINYKESL